MWSGVSDVARGFPWLHLRLAYRQRIGFDCTNLKVAGIVMCILIIIFLMFLGLNGVS
jgi:hypothetical protein